MRCQTRRPTHLSIGAVLSVSLCTTRDPRRLASLNALVMELPDHASHVVFCAGQGEGIYRYVMDDTSRS